MVSRLLACAVAAMLLFAPVRAARAHEELPAESPCHVLLEGTDEVVLVTGLVVHPGDEYLNARNQLYRVVRVDGSTAYAVFVEDVELTSPRASRRSPRLAGLLELAARRRPVVVGIYHTHSDESYVPTEGTASRRGGGGILEVGDTLARALEERGVRAIHDRTLHEPHDAAAYRRSRRTAVGLVRRGATVLLDVHRDTTPPEAYRTEVAGTAVTQVMLVVGRQNPARDAVVSWAREIKQTADRFHPGLIRGIFVGRGSYNQDLGSRTLLLEIGAHRNHRDEAEEGAALFADVLPAVLGAGGPEGTGALRALLVFLLLAAAAVALYLYVATGSWPAAADRARQFWRTEFRDLLRPLALRPRGRDGRGAGDRSGPG